MQNTLFDDVKNSSLINYDGMQVDAFDLAMYIETLETALKTTSSILFQKILTYVQLNVSRMTTPHQKCLRWARDWHNSELDRYNNRQKVRLHRQIQYKIEQERDFQRAGDIIEKTTRDNYHLPSEQT